MTEPLHVRNPPRVVIKPSPPRKWTWMLRSDFDDGDPGYQHAYWFFGGTWHFSWRDTAGYPYRDDPCCGTKRSKRAAERAGKRALKRLMKTLEHMEELEEYVL